MFDKEENKRKEISSDYDNKSKGNTLNNSENRNKPPDGNVFVYK